MTSQAAIMLCGEGDRWFARNRDKLGQVDPVCDLLEQHKVVPTAVLEIGCSDGWRLKKLRERYGCAVNGIDASEKAVKEAEAAGIDAQWCSADKVSFVSRRFDLVIFGFCLYLVDRVDLLRVVFESDRVLKDGGHIVVHDFYHPDRGTAYRTPYVHRVDLWSYHMNHEELWLAHPSYRRLGHIMPDDDTAAVLLKKDHAASWPVLG